MIFAVRMVPGSIVMSEKTLAGQFNGAYDCSVIVAAETISFQRKISAPRSEVERSDLSAHSHFVDYATIFIGGANAMLFNVFLRFQLAVGGGVL